MKLFTPVYLQESKTTSNEILKKKIGYSGTFLRHLGCALFSPAPHTPSGTLDRYESPFPDLKSFWIEEAQDPNKECLGFYNRSMGSGQCGGRGRHGVFYQEVMV